MSDVKAGTSGFAERPEKGDGTLPVMRSRSSQDGRPLQTIITEKAIHGAVPTEYALLKPSVWHSTQWQHEGELAAVRFSDGSTTFLQMRPPGTLPVEMTRSNEAGDDANKKPVIGSLNNDLAADLEKQLSADHDES